MSEDFGVHPELFTDLVEVLGVAGRAMDAIEQLATWVADDERHVETEELPGHAASADCTGISNPRGVFVRGEGDLIESFLPPYGATAQAVVDSVLAPPA